MKRILIAWFFASALGGTCSWVEHGPYDDQGTCENVRTAWLTAMNDGSQEVKAEFCIDR